jgi:hypothetical protein
VAKITIIIGNDEISLKIGAKGAFLMPKSTTFVAYFYIILLFH